MARCASPKVTARFTLDALPGKQMSIDSDLNAGLIDESEARLRRKQLANEAEFYGAMDGASRFTQRDAVAAILITGINIIAGLLIGILQHGMDFGHAIETYTVLTIGDGLVTVIPALMISISGGLIVTRTSSDTRLGADFRKQVFGSPQPLLLASGVLLALGAFPGLPTVPFVLLGAGMGASAWRMRKRKIEAQQVTEVKAAPPRENLEAVLRVEPLAVEVGLGLVRLVEGGKNSPLLRRISGIRRQLAGDLGYVFPPVRVTDNLSLKPREYAISMKGVEVARYEMPQGCDLAIPMGKPSAPVAGQATREPAFGMPAWWIPSDQSERARRANYTVVDLVSVLGTHLAELIRRHAHELFSRQDAKKLLDRVAVENPKVVEELTPKLLPLATVQRVLQNLLRERVSIRDAASILEALSEAGASSRNPILLTEFVRQAIRRTVVKPYLNASGDFASVFCRFVRRASRRIIRPACRAEQPPHHGAASHSHDVLSRVQQKIGSPETPVVAVTSAGARYFLRQIAEASMANVAFLSHNEVPVEVKVVSQGLIQ